MTVAALPSKKDYTENGATLSFAVPFRFLAGSIVATRTLVDGTVVTLAPGVDFATTGGDTDVGGTLTLTTTIAGAKLSIRRVTPRAQGTEYPVGDRFPAAANEAVVDRAMLIDQEQDVVLDEATANIAMLSGIVDSLGNQTDDGLWTVDATIIDDGAWG